jgi:hypothetical protein
MVKQIAERRGLLGWAGDFAQQDLGGSGDQQMQDRPERILQDTEFTPMHKSIVYGDVTT